MRYIERELERLERELDSGVGNPRYPETYAARQALAWVLNPTAARSPCDYLTDAPVCNCLRPPQPPTGQQEMRDG